MTTVWGYKQTRRGRGYIAEWCPVCREMTAHKLIRMGSAFHINYVNFTDGRLLGFELRCEQCQTPYWLEEHHYPHFTAERLPLDQLIRETHRDYHQRFAQVLALSQKARTEPMQLTAEERHFLMASTLVALSYKWERHESGTRARLALCWQASIGLLFAGAVYAVAEAHAEPLTWTLAGIMAGSALLITTGLRRWARQQYLRRHIYPALARSMAPLQLPVSELQQVLRELREDGYELASVLDETSLLHEADRYLQLSPIHGINA